MKRRMVQPKPLEIHKDLTYPNIGPRDLAPFLSRRIGVSGEEFHHQACTLDDVWTRDLTTQYIQNIGMARADEGNNGMKIVPLQFLS